MIQRTTQHLFGHFRVWKFVLDGFLAMATAEDSDMELAVWKKVW